MDEHLLMTLRFFSLPLGIGPNDKGPPFKVVIQATMCLPVPWCEPMSSVFLGKCVTRWAIVANGLSYTERCYTKINQEIINLGQSFNEILCGQKALHRRMTHEENKHYFSEFPGLSNKSVDCKVYFNNCYSHYIALRN